jgi:hypothetical protein
MGSPSVEFTRSRAIDSWHAKMEGASVAMDVWDANLYPHRPSIPSTGMREVRILARFVAMCYHSCAGEERIGPEALLDLLCPPCMESMEIRSGSDYPTIGQLPGQHNIPNAWRIVMRKMMHAYGSQFAFEVDDGPQKRAAWRRWPAQGTQEHDTACRLHEEARNWATA